MKAFLKALLLAPIKLYQYAVSPLLGNNCRFYPSCSEYAVQAIDRFPLYKALPKIVWRILRCHPFSRGGHDPVERG